MSQRPPRHATPDQTAHRRRLCLKGKHELDGRGFCRWCPHSSHRGRAGTCECVSCVDDRARKAPKPVQYPRRPKP